jgi:hypothetical protein
MLDTVTSLAAQAGSRLHVTDQRSPGTNQDFTCTAALARLTPQPGGPPLLAVATGPYAGEGFDCPPLDTLFLAAPIASKGRLLAVRRPYPSPYDGKATAEVHDYHDELTGVLASSLAKRAPGYTSLGFPDPRKLPYAPSADVTECFSWAGQDCCHQRRVAKVVVTGHTPVPCRVPA